MMLKTNKGVLSGLILIGFLFSISFVSAATAEIWTSDISGDLKTDFAPGELVYINGKYFERNTLIFIEIERPNLEIVNLITFSDQAGRFLYVHAFDPMIGTYYVSATDGVNTALTEFTDAAIWTTRGDCGDSTQDANHFDIGEMVFINGDGFAQEGFDWRITGRPGGASCDPGINVANGTYATNATGEFCFHAYTVANDDCGEYQVKFGVKGDNYRVEGNECFEDVDCGESGSELICQGNEVYNETSVPECSDGECIISNLSVFVRGCGLPSSNLICVGNNITNITTVPTCGSGECLNETFLEIVETCALGCSNAQCNEYEPECGNNITDPGEECDDGNDNDLDECRNDCTLPYCGDGILDQGEGCEPANTDTCDMYCQPIIPCDYDWQCGTDGSVGGLYCEGNSTAQDYINFTCNNPGTPEAWCSNSTYTETEECLLGCTDGVCDEYEPECRNGILDDGEECDDGNDNDLDECRNDCTLPYCGDDIIDVGEECDDGGVVDGDGCNSQCVYEYCGDGIIQQNLGEQCEPPNTDVCDSSCQEIQCDDPDGDGVCDDKCPDTKPGEPVDEDGCDIFQFCNFYSCSPDCFTADWRDNEPEEENPRDCTIVFTLSNGIHQQPRCAPTEFSNQCAG